MEGKKKKNLKEKIIKGILYPRKSRWARKLQVMGRLIGNQAGLGNFM